MRLKTFSESINTYPSTGVNEENNPDKEDIKEQMMKHIGSLAEAVKNSGNEPLSLEIINYFNDFSLRYDDYMQKIEQALPHQ